MNTRSPHHIVVWEFQVKPEAKLAFEQAYGPAGDWAQLFGRSPEYRGTKLLRDRNRPGRYLTLDHWTSREAFRQFKEAHHAEYDAFDRQFETLTDTESFIGEFESLSAASA